MADPVVRLTGEELLSLNGKPFADSKVLDFWRWAFSDLKANNLRGVFAEWIVARLLVVDAPVRDSWAGWDIGMPKGVRIEVKSSAYLQSWQQRKPSSIVFSGLCGRLEDPPGVLAETASYNADLYVFCVQIERDARIWDALDLAQWRFYILRREQVEQTGYKSLGLSTIAKLTNELGAEEFRLQALQVIEGIARSLDGQDLKLGA